MIACRWIYVLCWRIGKSIILGYLLRILTLILIAWLRLESRGNTMNYPKRPLPRSNKSMMVWICWHWLDKKSKRVWKRLITKWKDFMNSAVNFSRNSRRNWKLKCLKFEYRWKKDLPQTCLKAMMSNFLLPNSNKTSNTAQKLMNFLLSFLTATPQPIKSWQSAMIKMWECLIRNWTSWPVISLEISWWRSKQSGSKFMR